MGAGLTGTWKEFLDDCGSQSPEKCSGCIVSVDRRGFARNPGASARAGAASDNGLSDPDPRERGEEAGQGGLADADPRNEVTLSGCYRDGAADVQVAVYILQRNVTNLPGWTVVMMNVVVVSVYRRPKVPAC